MSPEEVELSSDLEWMLLSGQVEAPTLVSRLVHEEYANLYRLALSCLGDPDLARAAAKEALARAVLSAHQYDAQEEARTWLCAITREVCQARQRRPFDQGISQGISGFMRRVLSNGANIPPPTDKELQKNSHPPALAEVTDETVVEFSRKELDQIATDIHATVKKRRQRLKRWTAWQQIALIAVTSALLIWAGKTLDEHIPTPQRPTAEKRRAIVTQVVYVNPTQAPTSTPTSFPKGAVMYEVERAGTLRTISAKVGVAGEILSSLNGMPPDQQLKPGQKVMIGVGAPPLAMVTPTPVTPAPLPEALTSDSTFEAVFRRIQESRKNWSTLWADAVEMDYGPNGFASPPEVKRYQVWISQPSYDQVLVGDLNGQLSWAWRRVSENVYALDFEREKRSLSSSYAGPLGFTAELGNMLYPERHRYPAQGKIAILGVEQIAGRESLVLDWHYDDPNDRSERTGYMGRYWVDTITGVITRRQQFIQGNPELLLKDIVILDIDFDANFSNALFDQNQPFPANFASDYRGTPEPPEATLSIP